MSLAFQRLEIYEKLVHFLESHSSESIEDVDPLTPHQYQYLSNLVQECGTRAFQSMALAPLIAQIAMPHNQMFRGLGAHPFLRVPGSTSEREALGRHYRQVPMMKMELPQEQSQNVQTLSHSVTQTHGAPSHPTQMTPKSTPSRTFGLSNRLPQPNPEDSILMKPKLETVIVKEEPKKQLPIQSSTPHSKPRQTETARFVLDSLGLTPKKPFLEMETNNQIIAPEFMMKGVESDTIDQPTKIPNESSKELITSKIESNDLKSSENNIPTFLLERSPQESLIQPSFKPTITESVSESATLPILSNPSFPIKESTLKTDMAKPVEFYPLYSFDEFQVESQLSTTSSPLPIYSFDEF